MIGASILTERPSRSMTMTRRSPGAPCIAESKRSSSSCEITDSDELVANHHSRDRWVAEAGRDRRHVVLALARAQCEADRGCAKAALGSIAKRTRATLFV